MKKVVLLVMTKKGFEVVKKAIKSHKKLIDFIVIGSDKSVQNDYSSEIVNLAKESGVDFYLRGSEPIINKNKFVLTISWRWMVNHPVNKLIVFHDSILPRYRGFAPLVNMLIRGEKKIGVSAIFGAQEFDKGDLISQQSSDISYPITISEAIDINNKNFITLVDRVMSKISTSSKLNGIKQVEADATYSTWRDSDDYFIDWSRSAEEIRRLIDAVGSPYMGARSLTADGKLIRITKAEAINDVSCELRHVGKVIFINNGIPDIICGSGLLRILEAHIIDNDQETNYLPMKSFRVKFT
jgi:methionyl-tRNA formyltransferase